MRINSRRSWSSRIRLRAFFITTCLFSSSNHWRFDDDFHLLSSTIRSSNTFAFLNMKFQKRRRIKPSQRCGAQPYLALLNKDLIRMLRQLTRSSPRLHSGSVRRKPASR
jgi:hypothetical protein